MSLILEGNKETGSLWISSLPDILKTDLIARENIRAVCSVVIMPYIEKKALLKRLEEEGRGYMQSDDLEDISYLYIPVKDIVEEHIERYFECVAQFIHEHRILGKNVVVHCHASKSRSVTCLAYYLLRSEYMDSDEALEYIKERHALAAPNKGFIQKLHDLDE